MVERWPVASDVAGSSPVSSVAIVAQLVERRPTDPKVRGSSPFNRSICSAVVAQQFPKLQVAGSIPVKYKTFLHGNIINFCKRLIRH